MNPEGVIFDLDGTLLDSMPAWENIGSDFLKQQGIEPPENLDNKLKKLSFQESALLFKEEYKLLLDEEEIVESFNRMVYRLYAQTIPLKSGAEKLVKAFYQRGVKLCVLTATSKQLAELALKRMNLYPYFEFVASIENMGVSKTEPESYLKTAEKLNCRELLVFEDALYCIETVKKTDFPVIGVYDQSSDSDWPEIRKKADWALESFEEIFS